MAEHIIVLFHHCILFLVHNTFVRMNHRTIAWCFSVHLSVCLSVCLGWACIVIIQCTLAQI